MSQAIERQIYIHQVSNYEQATRQENFCSLSLSRLAINNGQLIDNKPKPKKKEFRLFHLIHIYVY